MFTSKLAEWLDEVDPYAVQQMAMVKSLVIATVLVYVYWIFRPMYFSAFITPTLFAYYYENPMMHTFKERNLLLLFIFSGFLVGNISLYFMFPFKVFFFIYAIIFFVGFYSAVNRHYPQLKSVTMLVVAYSLFTLGITPSGSIQVAYNIFFSSILCILTLFACLCLYPNRYFIVWSRALQKYIACMEVDIDDALHQQMKTSDAYEVIHLHVVRTYRKLLQRNQYRHAYRMVMCIRNIQLALNNIFFEKMNEPFWRFIQSSLKNLRISMKNRCQCTLAERPDTETELQRYVLRCLSQSIQHWNQLCAIQTS